MTFAAPDALPSGKPYPVSDVRGEPPTSLDQFVGDSEFGVEREGGVSRVRGTGTAVGEAGETVRFHEKDQGSSGKDVRVWTVRRQSDGFTAELASLF